jgi:hypothetical protein
MEISQEELDKQLEEAKKKGQEEGASAKASELQGELSRVKKEADERVSKMETDSQRKVSEQADELGRLRKTAEEFETVKKENDERKAELEKIAKDREDAEKKAKEAAEKEAARPKEILSTMTEDEGEGIDSFLAGKDVPEAVREAVDNEETREKALALILQEMRDAKPPEKGKEKPGLASQWLQGHKRTATADPETIRATLKDALKKNDQRHNRVPGMSPGSPAQGDGKPGENGSSKPWAGFRETAAKPADAT